MGTQKRPLRFNRYSIGRAAILFQRGVPRNEIIQKYFERYGKEWGINTVEEFEHYLFQRSKGSRPSLSELFEGKSAEQMHENYRKWMSRHHTSQIRSSARMVSMNRNPTIRKKQEENKKPEFKERRRAFAASDLFQQRRDERLAELFTTTEYREKNRANIQAIGKKSQVRKGRSKRMRGYNADPKFQRARAHGMSISMKKRYEDPAWRAERLKKVREGVKRRWLIIRGELLRSFKSRNLKVIYDRRTSRMETISTQNVIDGIILDEQKRNIERAVSNLDPLEMSAVSLNIFEGKTIERAARQLQITPLTFHRALDQALSKLSKQLANAY